MPAGDEVASTSTSTPPAASGDPDADAPRGCGAALAAAALRASDLRRIVVARFGRDVGDRDGVSSSFTFRQPAAGYAEEPRSRGVHPMHGQAPAAVAAGRTSALERLPSADDVYLFRAVAHANPKDERLFAIAEVRDLTPVRDAHGRVVAAAVPRAHAGRGAGRHCATRRRSARPRERLHWNRVLLYVWPPLDLRPDELNGIMRRLAPATDGLGLEQVMSARRIPDRGRQRALRERRPAHRPTPAAAACRRPIEPPPEQPLRPMTEYEQKVVRMRQRGLLYPYELIRMLTPAAAGARATFRAGTFVEYDLDADLHGWCRSTRPHGQNTANLVVGVIRNRHRRAIPRA